MGLPNVIGDLRADGSIKMTAALDLNSHKVLNLTDGSSAQDAAAFHQAGGGGGSTPWTVPDFTSHVWFNQGSATATMKRNNQFALLHDPPHVIDSYRLLMLALPSTPYAVEVGLYFPALWLSMAPGIIGPAIYDNGSGKFSTLNLASSGTTDQVRLVQANYNSVTSFHDSAAHLDIGLVPFGTQFFLRMEDDGTSYTHKFSFDSLTWVTVGSSQTRASFVTSPTHAGLMFEPDSNNINPLDVVVFHYAVGTGL